MPRILRAHGPNGNQGANWNWCEGERVGVHGFVCDSACSCGCSRSFVGIDSAKSCTRAVVEEVPEADYQTMRQRLRQRILKGWADDEAIADEAVRCFDEPLGQDCCFGLQDRLAEELLTLAGLVYQLAHVTGHRLVSALDDGMRR